MAGLPGPAFYDDERVFATYWESRERPDNPNDSLEQPLMRELAGDLRDLRILDLGCGAATFGIHALGQGATRYLGLDASERMVAAARANLVDTIGQVETAAIETWPYPEARFDVVVSSLALHYVADLSVVLAGAWRALVPGGRLIVSVEHPVITSCARGWQGGSRVDWIVDDYFVSGPRVTEWLGGRVVRQHRTVEDYVVAMQDAGFILDQLRESRPERERFTDEAEYERRRRIPLFLFLAGHRPEEEPRQPR